MIGCHLEVALPASCCTAASDVLHYVNAIGSSRVYTVAESTRVSYERRTCNSFAPKAHLDSDAHEQVLLACFDCGSYVHG